MRKFVKDLDKFGIFLKISLQLSQILRQILALVRNVVKSAYCVQKSNLRLEVVFIDDDALLVFFDPDKCGFSEDLLNLLAEVTNPALSAVALGR